VSTIANKEPFWDSFINDLKSVLNNVDIPAAGWPANKLLGTDENGNVCVKEAPDVSFPEAEADLSKVITIEEAVSSHTPNYMPDKSEFVDAWITSAGKFYESSNNKLSPFIAIDESLIGEKLTVQRYASGVWERLGQLKSVTAFTDIVEPDANNMYNSAYVVEALNNITANSADGTYAVYTIPEGTKYIRVAVDKSNITNTNYQTMFIINDESILGEYVANESVSIEGKKELVDDIMVNGSNLSENAMQKINEKINVDSAKPLRVSALSRMFTCADETEDYISAVDTYLKTGNKTAWLYGLYDELVTAYPEYVTRTQIATTASPTLPIYKADGTERTDITSDTVFPMYRYDFTPPISANTNKVVNSLEREIALPKILYTGGIHGSEYYQVIAAYRFFKMLCEKWEKYELLEDLRWNVHFVVVPLTNPFGFNYPSGRVNAEGTGVGKLNERNVDISGNFPSDSYVSGDKGKYGTAALSEPESVAIYNIIQNEDFILGIDNHTYGYLGTEYDGEHMAAYFIANHTKHPQSTEFWFKIGRWLNSRVRKFSPDIANTSYKNSDLSQLWTDPKDQMLNNTFRSVGANIEMPISIDPVKTTHEDASTGLLPMAEETQAYMVDLLATVFYESLNDFYTY
jgi:hypothetical protein